MKTAKDKYRIGPFFILKVLVLLVIFATALYSMYYLNTRGLEKTAFATLFGATASEEWRLCPKELLSLSLDTKNPETSWKILKAQNDWQLLYGGKKEFLSAENVRTCIQRVCQFKVTKRAKQDFVDFQETLNYQFMDMTSLILRLNSDEKTLFWEGNLYQANDLIDYLAKIPRHHCK
jgi:hypothetical protein